MARILFTHEGSSGGTILRLMETRWHSAAAPIPVAAWADRIADQAFSGISRILALADDVDSAVALRDDGLFIDHRAIASLSEPQALGLGLPPSVRFALQVNTRNLITDHDFGIFGRWVDEANRPLRVEREGAFLFVEGDEYRLPEPLFSLVSAIDDFASADTMDNDVRMERLAHLQSLLPQEANEQLSVDSYFSNFRVMHASAFSLSLRIEGRSFDFDPILFGRRAIEQHRAEDDSLGPVSEAESLLTEYQQGVFAKERFRSSEDVKSSYLIERGIYLHLDPSLRSAMAVVRQMQRANAESRRRFVQAPQLYLKEALSKVLADDEVERLFVETEQYSARVIDIGVWTPPVFPWIKKEPNDWLPEKFGLKVGNKFVVLKTDEISPLRERIKEARESGKEFVEFGDENTRIPATAEAEQSLSQLLGAIGPTRDPEKTAGLVVEPSEERVRERRVLIVEENFDKLGFIKKVAPRKRAISSLPAAIRPSLMKHQESGLGWMQETWARGYAGALLADDMGLGKTLQALGFLAWLREAAAASRSFVGLRGPIIIVAPTGLLANWEKEHDHHLHHPGLGEICRAYGRHLKILKTVSTRDVDRGAPSLDHRRIQQASWVLTTYETLRDHHLSFASIPFSCAVFDEMQKVKSPSSLLTGAAKTLNAEFTLGLTGTPIENQLADLWCIMDIINPGCLGDLKTFSTKYAPDDLEALKQLHDMLLVPGPDDPAPMLRRMKVDELDGLPEKRIHIRKRQMPDEQARIYADIVTRAKEPESGPMLETLHSLRGVSLHPIWPPAGEIEDQKSFISQSARLTETFLILDEIAEKKEKALIFLESLDLQEHLALMIKTRYGLKRRPVQINGEVSGEKRQALVDQFQAQRSSFDVMILSPRAGGVGLTLTSANHVIHLSRWWNPAVEDQCTDRVYRIGQDRTVHIYYPMAVHPLYGESSFDALLNALLARKRDLSRRMLLPPVNSKQDQNWFAENLGRKSPEVKIVIADIEDIDVMEPIAFERWALGRCASLGWEVSRTPRSYDGGADGILLHRASGARAIVQCKHTQSDNGVCGPEAIDDLLRARTNYAGTTRLFVLTNAVRFSRSAFDRAEKYGIELIGRSALPHWPRQLLS
jgi:superfamily II DNA or RNA helicase